VIKVYIFNKSNDISSVYDFKKFETRAKTRDASVETETLKTETRKYVLRLHHWKKHQLFVVKNRIIDH